MRGHKQIRLCGWGLFLAGAFLCSVLAAQSSKPDWSKEGWIPLFNGQNLDGWIPKICGYPLGENFGNTFRVENGVLKVVYDRYHNRFGGRFGHLFYKVPFTNYVLRVRYRFVGNQLPDGPGWAYRNSGIMIHCQDPKTMRLNQPFPVCVECQLLGGDKKRHKHRPTANVCTPGTDIVMDGKLVTQHCINSTSPTFYGDQWVTVELEVHNSRLIRHWVNGRLVFSYSQPQLDPRDPDARRLLNQGAPKLLKSGYIALQSESHPVEFSKVEILLLDQ